MSVGHKIKLSPQAEKIVSAYGTLPHRLIDAMRRAMDESNQLAIANIKAAHLTGKGPFPIEEHRLGRVTGRLRGSVSATETRETGNGRLQSAIGSNVVYAAIHEFGGAIHHSAREMTVRHKLEKDGTLAKQSTNANLLVFAKNSAKHFRETKAQAKAYDQTMPERAPFRAGIQETAPKYTSLVSAAIVAEWSKLT
jgi:phage gpG-like protein